MWRILTHAWTRQCLLAWLLWPLSWLFGVMVRTRRSLYRRGWLASERLAVPVMVVGNVVAGGAGKTPTVIAVVKHLQAHDVRVGVISRGYGRRNRDCQEVSATSTPLEVGDEPLLIFRNTSAPVVVSAVRAQAARKLLLNHPHTQILVCDDGLQHFGLHRDLEIGVFDDRGVGNGFLLPAGPLREPWPRPLDLVLHTGQHPAFAGLTARRSLADHAVRADGSQVRLTELVHSPKPVLAVSAIAQPEAFFAMLRDQGLPLEDTEALPDHYEFNRWTRNSDGRYRVICTEKDAVKLWSMQPDVLAVPLEFEPEIAFWTALDQRIGPLLQQRELAQTARSTKEAAEQRG